MIIFFEGIRDQIQGRSYIRWLGCLVADHHMAMEDMAIWNTSHQLRQTSTASKAVDWDLVKQVVRYRNLDMNISISVFGPELLLP